MGKIIYLMGKSSTGKDTIYKRLLESKDIDVAMIVPYTTRPIRANEKQGVEYFFTNEEEFDKLARAGKVIEARVYHTYHGDWRYFTVDDGQIDLQNTRNYMIIGTLESYRQTARYFGNESMIPVLIELDDGIRLQRALDREKIQKEPKYQEMCRRFLADAEDFSEENISLANIDKRFHNNVLEDCLQEITTYIRKNL